MKYAIKVTDLAKQMIMEISDRRIRDEIAKRIDKLANDPSLQGKPLKGTLTGYRSVRTVGQRYRIVYKIHEEKVMIYVIGMGIRKEGSKDDIYVRLQKLLLKGFDIN